MVVANRSGRPQGRQSRRYIVGTTRSVVVGGMLAKCIRSPASIHAKSCFYTREVLLLYTRGSPSSTPATSTSQLASSFYSFPK